MIASFDELLDFIRGFLGDPPLVEHLLERLYVQLLERTPMYLTCPLTWKVNELRTAERILSLEVPLFPIGVLNIVGVVFLKRRRVDLSILAQLLLPPTHRLLKVESTIFQERPELKAPSMFQMFLLLALIVDKPAHARREGPHQELFEILHGELFANILPRGLLRNEQLHTMVLQRLQEASNSWVGQGGR